MMHRLAYQPLPATAPQCASSGCANPRQFADEFCGPCRDDIEDFVKSGEVNATTKRKGK